jgi:hypothetical protein
MEQAKQPSQSQTIETLPSAALGEVATVRSRLPSWMAEQISKVAFRG